MSGIVLVTGGSGFVGSHVAVQLLKAGYAVLGWQPRSWQDAVAATAESLLSLGLVAVR